jgi:hypothetical protein
VLGTDIDTPSLEQQRQMLTDAGVIWPTAAPRPDCWRVNLSAKGRTPDESVTIQPAAERY